METADCALPFVPPPAESRLTGHWRGRGGITYEVTTDYGDVLLCASRISPASPTILNFPERTTFSRRDASLAIEALEMALRETKSRGWR